MSDSLRPHGLQPTRLLRPWDFPPLTLKTPIHPALVCDGYQSHSPHSLQIPFCGVVAKSCPTLCDPMDCSSPGSSVCVILQARILEWIAMPFSIPSPRHPVLTPNVHHSLQRLTPSPFALNFHHPQRPSLSHPKFPSLIPQDP